MRNSARTNDIVTKENTRVHYDTFEVENGPLTERHQSMFEYLTQRFIPFVEPKSRQQCDLRRSSGLFIICCWEIMDRSKFKLLAKLLSVIRRMALIYLYNQ